MTTTPSAVFYLFCRHCTHWFMFLHEIFSHRQITSYSKFLRVVDHQLSQRLWKKCVSYKRCRKSFVQVSVVVTKKLRWSQRVFLIFLFLRTGEYRDSRIRSGEKEKPLLWLKSHFHADASCQTRQFNNNSNREQWKLYRLRVLAFVPEILCARNAKYIMQIRERNEERMGNRNG